MGNMYLSFRRYWSSIRQAQQQHSSILSIRIVSVAYSKLPKHIVIPFGPRRQPGCEELLILRHGAIKFSSRFLFQQRGIG